MSNITLRTCKLEVRLNKANLLSKVSINNLDGFTFYVRGVKKTTTTTYNPYTSIYQTTYAYEGIYNFTDYKKATVSKENGKYYITFFVPPSADTIDLSVGYSNSYYSGPSFSQYEGIGSSYILLNKECTYNKLYGWASQYAHDTYGTGKITASICASTFRGYCWEINKYKVYSSRNNWCYYTIFHEIGHSISYQKNGVFSSFGFKDLLKILPGLFNYTGGNYSKLTDSQKEGVMHLEFPADLYKCLLLTKLGLNLDFGYFNDPVFSDGKNLLQKVLNLCTSRGVSFEKYIMDRICATKSYSELRNLIISL